MLQSSNEFKGFSPLIEEIAQKLNMNLRGKCFMTVFHEQVLYKAFREITTDSKPKSPGLLFISKLNKAKTEVPKEKWRAYYLLLEQFGLPKAQYSYFNEIKPVVFQQPIKNIVMPYQQAKPDFESFKDIMQKTIAHIAQNEFE